MSAAAVRQLSGPDAMRAAEELRQKQNREKRWPYEFLFPPPESLPVNGGSQGVGFVAVPNAPGPVTVAQFQVQSGFRFIMTGILQAYDDGVFLPGDTLWTVTVNPQGGVQANPVQGLIQSPVPMGSWKFGTGPWHFDRPYEFAPLDLISSVANNVSLASAGSYVSGFFGYLIPDTSAK